MILRHPFRRLSATLFGIVCTVSQAGACPDCALINSGGTIEPQTVTAKLAFSFSTILMLGVFFCVFGFLVWIMVKTCRDLEKERLLSGHGEL